jgi:hypothetical protein
MTAHFEQAARWVAEARGKVWPQDRTEVMQITNDVRELFYDFSVTPWQTTLCVPVRTLCQECNTCGPFLGVSLPAFVQQALGVYDLAGRAIPVVDRWGIYPYDQETLSDCGSFRFTDLGEEYPFLSDPPCGVCYKIKLFPKVKTDIGKVVTLRYLDANDIERTDQLMLGYLPVETTYWVKGIARNGVSLPTGLNGAISARSDNGTQLAEWQPWELVPGYRRLKLETGACQAGCMVVVHVERRRYKLCALTDPVETDQKRMAAFLNLHPNCYCHHDLAAETDMWREESEDLAMLWEFVGEVSTYGWLPKATRVAGPKVFIERDPYEVWRSLVDVVGDLNAPELTDIQAQHRVATDWARKHRALVVPFNKVHNIPHLREIWKHIFGSDYTFPVAKARLFVKFNIQRADAAGMVSNPEQARERLFA